MAGLFHDPAEHIASASALSQCLFIRLHQEKKNYFVYLFYLFF